MPPQIFAPFDLSWRGLLATTIVPQIPNRVISASGLGQRDLRENKKFFKYITQAALELDEAH